MEVETSTEQQPAKVFDIVNDKFIDNPLLKKPETEETEEEESEEEKPEKPTKKEEKATETEKSEEDDSEESDEETEDSDESEEESEEEEKESDEDEEETEDEDGEDITTPDAFISHFYGEKYGVKTDKDLVAMLDASIEANAELEEIRAERESWKKEKETILAEAGKPKFKSDKEQKAFEFLSQFDIDRQGEALDSFAKILTMDLEKANPKMILEEAFVNRNINKWNREEAQKMFAREYSRKYNIKREAFEGSDAEYEEEKNYLKTLEKGDVEDAKSYLRDQKSKYKPQEKPETPGTPEVVTKAIEKNAREYTDHLTGIKDIPFKDSDGDEYSFKLEAKHKSQLSKAIDAWVKNPASYDDKGVLKGISSPNQMSETLAWSMFHDEMLNAFKSQMKNLVNTKRVEDIAKKQPQKRSAPAGSQGSSNKDDLDEQAILLIKSGKHKKAA